MRLHDGRAGHRLRDAGAHAWRAAVILVRAGEIEIIVPETGAVDHAVLRRREPTRVESVVRPVLAETLCAQIDRHAQRQDAIGRTEVDRDPVGQSVEVAEAAGLGELEGIIALVSSRQDCLVEQQRIAIAVAEPAFDAGLQRPCPCCAPAETPDSLSSERAPSEAAGWRKSS